MSRLRNSRRVLRETNYEEVSDGVLNEDGEYIAIVSSRNPIALRFTLI